MEKSDESENMNFNFNFDEAIDAPVGPVIIHDMDVDRPVKKEIKREIKIEEKAGKKNWRRRRSPRRINNLLMRYLGVTRLDSPLGT